MLPYHHKRKTLVLKEVARCYFTDMIYRDTLVKEVARCYLTDMIYRDTLVQEVARCYLTVI